VTAGVGAEAFIAQDWLHDVLTLALNPGDPIEPLAPGGVWRDLAPATVNDYPLVTYQLQDPGTDLMEVGQARVWTNMLWLVRGIMAGDSTRPLVPVATAIDAALHRADGAVEHGLVIACTRVGPFSMTERTPAGAVTFQHLGGVYRLLVQGGS
jgi:hypothetical protein